MYQISFYVPTKDADSVKSAMFKAGAGKINNYSNCSWQTKGMGQFIAKDSAKPSLGKLDDLTVIQEYKVEMICEEDIIETVIEKMKKYHPYEEVAYSIIKLEQK